MLGVDQIVAAYVDEVQLIMGVRSHCVAVVVAVAVAGVCTVRGAMHAMSSAID